MLTSQLEHIFTKENLKDAFLHISKTSHGIDDIYFKEFKKDLSKNIVKIIDDILQGKYIPEPLEQIEIDKPNSTEKRPIALSSIKDKIVQKSLYTILNPYFDKKFSNKSYAYRPNKSTMKAINRVTDILKEKNHYILKTDIDNFFETINHDKLLQILDNQIADKKIIKLISLFLQTGGFKKFIYDEHDEGIHQGDILSPLLSNIYLDMMDRWLEKYEIPFVRYADDFVILESKQKYIDKIQPKLEKFLASLDLKLELNKTYRVHISDGFTFLGVTFKGKNRIVENERVQKSISKLHKLSKNSSGFSKYIKEINFYLIGLKNYYFKIITKNSTQFQLFQNALIDSLS